MNPTSENAARLGLVNQAAVLARAGLDPLGSATVSMRWARPAADGLLLVSVSDCAALAALPLTPPAPLGLADNEAAGLSVPPEADLASWHSFEDERLAGVHGGLYAHRPDAGAVLLVASPFAATLACCRDVQLDGIPFFHPMVALSGRDRIDCCHPGFYAALSAETGGAALDAGSPLEMLLEALDGGRACLVAHYGQLVVAETPQAAVQLACQFEALCRIYWQVLQLSSPRAVPILTA